ncbi:MAG: MBL fold metallo-hydrolase [Thermoprotei archaeon]
MEVLVLGSGGTAPSIFRACTSFLVDRAVLVDVGPGSVTNMRRFGVSTRDIEAVLITHMHGDHLFDLPALLWAMAADGRKETLRVFGPKGVEQALGFLMAGPLADAFMPKNFVTFPIETRELNPMDSFSIGSHLVMVGRGDHPVQDLPYRISDGSRTVTFSGDTGPSDAVSNLAEGSDLLVHESTFLRGEEELARSTGHSTALEAGQVASKARVKMLLLNHLPARLAGKEESARSEASQAGVRSLVAYDGLSLHVE